METRIGHKSTANHAVTVPAMVQDIVFIREDTEQAEEEEKANYLIKLGAFVTICTAASLQGYEGFYTDLSALRRHLHVGKGEPFPPT